MPYQYPPGRPDIRTPEQHKKLPAIPDPPTQAAIDLAIGPIGDHQAGKITRDTMQDRVCEYIEQAIYISRRVDRRCKDGPLQEWLIRRLEEADALRANIDEWEDLKAPGPHPLEILAMHLRGPYALYPNERTP